MSERANEQNQDSPCSLFYDRQGNAGCSPEVLVSDGSIYAIPR